MENRSGLISIIIQVYNVENQIKRCLDSVVHQSYENIEIILIDDGSTDSSGEICDQYAQNDKRIQVLHVTNGGVSAARNKGLDSAKGEYIMFVDSDDWIDNKMCEKALCCLKNYDVDLVKTLAVNRDEEGIIKNNQNDIKSDLLIDVEHEFSFSEPYATGVIWGALYKSKLLNGLRFSTDLYVGEDTLFFAQAIKKCKRIIVAKDKMYNYVVYKSSASHGRMDAKKITNLSAWEQVVELFKSNKRICDSAKAAYSRQCAEFLQIMCENNDRRNVYWKFCSVQFRKYFLYLILCEKAVNKIKYICIFIDPRIWNFVKKLLGKR